MNRSKIDTLKAAIAEKNAGRSAEAEIEAEEKAINYLATLPVDVARGAAVKAAMWFFAVLEAEKSKITMLARSKSRRSHFGRRSCDVWRRTRRIHQACALSAISR